jgi:hypothetical protein
MNIKENAEALHRPRDAFCAHGLVLRRYVAGRPQGSDVRPTEGPCEHDSWLMIVEHLARYPLRMLHDHGRLCAPPVGWLLFRLAGEVDKDAAALGHKDSEAWRISQADHGQQGGTAIWPQRQPET